LNKNWEYRSLRRKEATPDEQIKIADLLKVHYVVSKFFVTYGRVGSVTGCAKRK
jgi:hypothetical protein